MSIHVINVDSSVKPGLVLLLTEPHTLHSVLVWVFSTTQRSAWRPSILESLHHLVVIRLIVLSILQRLVVAALQPLAPVILSQHTRPPSHGEHHHQNSRAAIAISVCSPALPPHAYVWTAATMRPLLSLFAVGRRCRVSTKLTTHTNMAYRRRFSASDPSNKNKRGSMVGLQQMMQFFGRGTQRDIATIKL